MSSDVFDDDKSGEVDFNEFLQGQGLSLFSTKGEKEDKLRFAFKIYDMDKDGYISNGELYQVFKREPMLCRVRIISLQVLKMMVGTNLKDMQLQQIVDRTILFADVDQDGKLSFEEFSKAVGDWEAVPAKMVVEV